MHEFQKCMHPCHADSCHHSGDHRCQDQCISYCLTHFVHLSCTVFLCCQYSKTCCQPKQKSDDQKNDRSCGTNRCQCFCSHKLSYYYSIYHVVELLEHITYEYRNSKSQQHFHRLSLCHVCFHLMSSPPDKNTQTLPTFMYQRDYS